MAAALLAGSDRIGQADSGKQELASDAPCAVTAVIRLYSSFSSLLSHLSLAAALRATC